MKSIPNFRIIVGSVAVFFAVSVAAQCQEGPQCSTEKVNHNCLLTIDRVDLLQPPTLQMYPGAVVTVKIENAVPFEQLSLDWQTSAGSLAPDQANAIMTALGPALQKVVAVVTRHPAPGPRTPNTSSQDQCANPDTTNVFACAAQMVADARLAMVDIGTLVNDDTVVLYSTGPRRALQSSSDFHDTRIRILRRVLGSKVAELNGTRLGCLPTKTDDCMPKSGDTPPVGAPPYHDLVGEQNSLSGLSSTAGSSDIPALVSYTGALISALEGVAQNLLLLSPDQPQPATGVLGTIVDPVRGAKTTTGPSCNSALAPKQGGQSSGRLLQRQISCALNVFNLVGNSIDSIPTPQQKRAILTITANYADTRVETSAGIMVSALPSRSFIANSTYSGTPPAVSGVAVNEVETWPFIVPYAAVHIRLGSDWLWRDRRRGAVYATILAGVNPNTTTADFGAGFSVSWRSLVLSPVAHFAHDVRLTGGFTNNEQLGASFSGSIPTQQFWTTSFGFGIGIRVPLISGR